MTSWIMTIILIAAIIGPSAIWISKRERYVRQDDKDPLYEEAKRLMKERKERK